MPFSCLQPRGSWGSTWCWAGAADGCNGDTWEKHPLPTHCSYLILSISKWGPLGPILHGGHVLSPALSPALSPLGSWPPSQVGVTGFRLLRVAGWPDAAVAVLALGAVAVEVWCPEGVRGSLCTPGRVSLWGCPGLGPRPGEGAGRTRLFLPWSHQSACSALREGVSHQAAFCTVYKANFTFLCLVVAFLTLWKRF